MKAVNKALRIKDIESSNEALFELGITELEIEKLRKPNCFGRIGFESYE